MFRRLLALLTAVTMFILTGCIDQLYPSSETSEPVVLDPDKYLSEFQNDWQYNTLSSEEKTYYGYLYTAVKEAENRDSSITIQDEKGTNQSYPGVRVSFPNAALSQERITALFEAFFRDNPQFFYLNRTYHLEGHSVGDGATIFYDTLILQFSMPLEQRRSAVAQLNDAIRTIAQNCPTDSDDYVRERYMHDQLAEKCSYDKEAAANSTDADSNAYTAYGALIEGKAVCEGYAKALQLLLKQTGIPVTVVSGNSIKTGEPHMWNLVKINGNTYYVDPTWNDSGTHLQHTYFNLTSAMLATSHKTDSNQPVVTDCTATKDNFFHRNNAFIDTYERQVIAQAIAEQLIAGNHVIQLKFGSGKFSNGQLFLKNRTLTCQMVNPLLADKELSLWEYQLWVDEEQQVLTLVKA